MRNKSIVFILSIILILLSSIVVNKAVMGQENKHKERTINTTAMPKWLEEHMQYLTEGKGKWITNNSTYKSETEPFEAYAIEWVWGVGKKSIRGRLFGLVNNKEVATFWEYHLFWHPKEHKAIFHQFGGDGTVGIGELRAIRQDNKVSTNLEQTFYTPDGKSWVSLHKQIEDKNRFETKSFTLTEGSWIGGRTYIWSNIEN